MTGRYPGVPPEKMPPFEDAWRALQTDLARASAGGRLVVAEESGHNVPGDQPEVIVRVIAGFLQPSKE